MNEVNAPLQKRDPTICCKKGKIILLRQTIFVGFDFSKYQ